MYYCYNCFTRFAHPIPRVAPYPDYGGERYAACPLCGAPDNFEKEGGREIDDQGNERTGGHRPQLRTEPTLDGEGGAPATAY